MVSKTAKYVTQMKTVVQASYFHSTEVNDWAWWHRSSILDLGDGEISEFEVSLVCIVRFRPTRALKNRYSFTFIIFTVLKQKSCYMSHVPT